MAGVDVGFIKWMRRTEKAPLREHDFPPHSTSVSPPLLPSNGLNRQNRGIRWSDSRNFEAMNHCLYPFFFKELVVPLMEDEKKNFFFFLWPPKQDVEYRALSLLVDRYYQTPSQSKIIL